MESKFLLTDWMGVGDCCCPCASATKNAISAKASIIPNLLSFIKASIGFKGWEQVSKLVIRFASQIVSNISVPERSLGALSLFQGVASPYDCVQEPRSLPRAALIRRCGVRLTSSKTRPG